MKNFIKKIIFTKKINWNNYVSIKDQILKKDKKKFHFLQNNNIKEYVKFFIVHGA